MEHGMIQIPVNEPDLSGNEQSYLLDTVKFGWIGTGRYVAEFERRFAEFIGTKYALSTISGTAAPHELMRRLQGKDIAMRTFFIPIHRQPVFQKRGLFRNERYPVADRLSEEGQYFPSELTKRKEQIERVADKMREIQKTVRG